MHFMNAVKIDILLKEQIEVFLGDKLFFYYKASFLGNL